MHFFSNADLLHMGECPNSIEEQSSCVCPDIYEPVCSTGNITYSSACNADCG